MTQKNHGLALIDPAKLRNTLYTSITINLLPFIMVLMLSIVINGVLCKCGTWIGRDNDVGIQKFHVLPASRLGGLGIAISVIFGILLIKNEHPNEAYLASFMMIAFIPIFFGGLLEDITHSISPMVRLCLGFTSALLVVYVTQMQIVTTDIAFIDNILKIPGFSLLLTVILIAGFSNSINIIDGFHGLASGAILIMLTAFAYICFEVEDYTLLIIVLVILVSLLGFILWNWPSGKIFLGDSGAYLLGIWVAMLGILLINRSKNISPMAPVLIGLYPMIETLFSIYRRKFLKSRVMINPDSLHLHTLIYRRLIYSAKNNISLQKKNSENARVALFIWSFIIIDSLIAIAFYKNTEIIILFIVISIMVYIKTYRSIVKFKIYRLFNIRKV